MTGWLVLEIELLWIVSLFNQDLASTCQIHPILKIPQSPVITNFNRMNASGNRRCVVSPFVISLMSLSYGCVLILPFCISSHPLPSWHHPHQTPSLNPFRADVVGPQIQAHQTGVLFQCRGQSLAGDTWLEKHDEAHSTHVQYSCKMFSRLSLFFKLGNTTTYWQENDPFLAS